VYWGGIWYIINLLYEKVNARLKQLKDEMIENHEKQRKLKEETLVKAKEKQAFTDDMTIKKRKRRVESPTQSPLPRSPHSSNKKMSPSAKTTAAGILVSMTKAQNESYKNKMYMGEIHSRMGKDETERPESPIKASTTISALPNPGILSGISVRIVGFFVFYVPIFITQIYILFSIFLRT
jgi:DNA mismatch repair ATPase MutL